MILFDLDGTLIDAAAAQRSAYSAAFATVFGRDADLDSIPHQGATMHKILGLLAGGAIEPADREAFTSAHADALRKQLHTSGVLIPGVRACLNELTALGEPLGIITGNSQAATDVALNHFGVSHFFGAGYYGNSASAREDLVALAIADYPDCVIVGDTPFDVLAAQAHRCPAVAVSTGPFSAEVLAQTGADLVLTTLEGNATLLHHLRQSHAGAHR